MKQDTTDLGQQIDLDSNCLTEDIVPLPSKEICFASEGDESVPMSIVDNDVLIKQQAALQEETRDLPRMTAVEMILELSLCETIRFCDTVLSAIPITLPDGIQFNFEAIGEGKTMLVIIATDCTKEAWKGLYDTIGTTLTVNGIASKEFTASTPASSICAA